MAKRFSEEAISAILENVSREPGLQAILKSYLERWGYDAMSIRA